MHIETFSHRLNMGWSAALPAECDSARTLVVAFGAPGYADAPQALHELALAFPKSAIVGCSSGGEIHDHLVADGTLVVAIALVSGLVILMLRRNSNVMTLDFRPTWPRGAAVAAGLGWSVLQLGKVTPFLYFNF